MKTIAVFAALVAVAVAAPQFRQQQPQLVVQQQQQQQQPFDYKSIVLTGETPVNNIGVDGYRFAYEQSNGHKRDESAQIVEGRDEENKPTQFLRVTGSYSFVNPYDGLTYSVTYTADENGFHPQGAHLPVPPVTN